MSTEFEKSMYEVIKKWVEVIGKSIDGDTPEPSPEPTPEPTPDPITKEPEIVYQGAKNITVNKDYSTVITFYGLNSTNDKDFAVTINGCYGAAPTFSYKLKQTRITNGFRFDYTVTGKNPGKGNISMSLYKDISNPDKYTTVNITVTE